MTVVSGRLPVQVVPVDASVLGTILTEMTYEDDASMPRRQAIELSKHTVTQPLHGQRRAEIRTR